MIELKLDSRKDAALAAAISYKTKAVQKAMIRAVKATHRWLERELAKAIAKEVLIPQKGIKPRIRAEFDRASLSGRIWIGLNPVSARRAGEPRQAGFGARAGQHKFEGAFVASVKSGTNHVWKRKGEGRFPIVKQMIDISDPGEEVIRRLESRAQDYFSQQLNSQLNYALNHEGGRS